jgi:hypothetical protein
MKHTKELKVDSGYTKELKADFRKFLFVIWKFLNLPDPTPIQYDIALHLMSSPKRAIVEAFRGVGKSWVASAYVLWLLYNDPDLRIMVVSASKPRADAFTLFTRRLISEVPELQHLEPRKGQRDSLVSFDVNGATTDQSPSVKSVGITGQLTGSRADVIVGDDIEVLNNSSTQDARDKLSELVKEFDAIIKPKKSSQIIYLGTPQTEMSLYNTLEDRGYPIKVWPAEKPTHEEVVQYKGRLADIILEMDIPAGTPTDPLRFNTEDLEERKLSYGKAGYSLQFMLNTSLSDMEKYPLRHSDFLVDEVNDKFAPAEYSWSNASDDREKDLPLTGLAGDRFYRASWRSTERLEYTGRLLTVDPSGRGKDETSVSVTYFLNGYIFIRKICGFRDGYSEKTLKAIAQLAKVHRVNEVVIEGNFGDGMFIQLFKPICKAVYPCNISEFKASGQKEMRIIDTVEPVLSQHRIVVDPRVIKEDHEGTLLEPQYGLMYQLARITKERGSLRQDDRIDNLAIALDYWNGQMDTDASENERKRLDELLNAELQDIVDFASGSASQSSDNWIHR